MIKQTILAASMLALTGTASAISTYQYDNFETSLDGEVGITSSYEFRGLTLNDQPAVYGKLELLGIDGTLKGGYIGGQAISIDLPQASSEWDIYTGWRTLNEVGFNGNVGYVYKFFSDSREGARILEDDLSYGELNASIDWTFDNDYRPKLGLDIGWSDNYYGNFGSTMYYAIEGEVRLPYSEAKLFAKAGYTDSQDQLFEDYGDYSVGAQATFGYMKTTLSYTWTDGTSITLPQDEISSGDNGTVNLTVAYNF